MDRSVDVRDVGGVTRRARGLQTAEAKAKQKKSKQLYESSEKAIEGRAYRVKMKQEWGDRYCNSLQHICWDVFK